MKFYLIKSEYSFELLKQETKKLLKSTEDKITCDKKEEIILQAEMNEVVLLYCVLLIKIIRAIREFFIHSFQII